MQKVKPHSKPRRGPIKSIPDSPRSVAQSDQLLKKPNPQNSEINQTLDTIRQNIKDLSNRQNRIDVGRNLRQSYRYLGRNGVPFAHSHDPEINLNYNQLLRKLQTIKIEIETHSSIPYDDKIKLIQDMAVKEVLVSIYQMIRDIYFQISNSDQWFKYETKISLLRLNNQVDI